MSEVKHTSGPWSFDRGSDCYTIKDATGNSIMGDAQYYPWAPEKDADWHLIAAAPELLESCRQLSNMLRAAYMELGMQASGKRWDAAQAAIKKALGS